MFLTALRRRKPTVLPFSPFPDVWDTLLSEQLPFYNQLSPEDRRILQDRVQLFLERIPFEGCAGFEVTDEVRLLIAAQAVLLILHRRRDGYPTVSRVLVYPSAFRASAEEGEHTSSWRAGEAWHRDYVILAWDHVVSGIGGGEDGRNVVIHEFAHHLDREDGTFDGVPPLPTLRLYRAWETTFEEEYERLKADIRDGRNPFLDPYGATNRAEFFAVASEYFFERGRELRRHHRALYELLVLFYLQDPTRPSRFSSRALDTAQLLRRAAACGPPATVRAARLESAVGSLRFLMRCVLIVLAPLLVIGLFAADFFLMSLWSIFLGALFLSLISAVVGFGLTVLPAARAAHNRIRPRRRLESFRIELVTAAADRGISDELCRELVKRTGESGFSLFLQYRRLEAQSSRTLYYSVYTHSTGSCLLVIPHRSAGLFSGRPTAESFYVTTVFSDGSELITSNDAALSDALGPDARLQIIPDWKPFSSVELLHRHAVENVLRDSPLETRPLASEGMALRTLSRSALFGAV